jgi:hypothetical protein
MGDDAEELSGWQLRVRELNEERAAAAPPPAPLWQRRLAGAAVVVVLVAVLSVGISAVVTGRPDSGTGTVSQQGQLDRTGDDADVDPEVVDAARECVAAGYGSTDECVVGAVISEGG